MRKLISLNVRQAEFLRTLNRDKPTMRRSGAAVYFADHFGIGKAYATQVAYEAKDYAAAAAMLINHGLPLEDLPAQTSRADAALYPGQSEKTSTAGPWSGLVAVKLLRAGETFRPPHMSGSFVCTSVDQARSIQCDKLLFVENMETFRNLEAYTWLTRHPDFVASNVLVLYRGDTIVSPSHANDLLHSRTEPVWAFTDFDPAGLAIANRLPRLSRLWLPSVTWLSDNARTGRGLELYDRSLSQNHKLLDQATNADVQAAWALMKRLQSSVVQEMMQHCKEACAMAAPQPSGQLPRPEGRGLKVERPTSLG